MQVTFLNKGAIIKQLSEVPEDSHVVVDMSHSFAVDHDVLELLSDFEATAGERGITVETRGKPRMRTAMAKSA